MGIQGRTESDLGRAGGTPLSWALDFLFPPRCFSCGARCGVVSDWFRGVRGGSPLCPSCEEKLERPSTAPCAACNREGPLSAFLAGGSECSAPSHRDYSVRAGFLMRGPGARLVHSFKYRGARHLARFIARRMLPAWAEGRAREADCLVPVPLHPKRLSWRGYNQSLLLAAELSALTDLPLEPHLLSRVRRTRPQARLPGSRRARNVGGAFAAPFPAALRGRTIVLVDDVATTGATLRSCTGTLLAAGAARVLCLVAAIA